MIYNLHESWCVTIWSHYLPAQTTVYNPPNLNSSVGQNKLCYPYLKKKRVVLLRNLYIPFQNYYCTYVKFDTCISYLEVKKNCIITFSFKEFFYQSLFCHFSKIVVYRHPHLVKANLSNSISSPQVWEIGCHSLTYLFSAHLLIWHSEHLGLLAKAQKYT